MYGWRWHHKDVYKWCMYYDVCIEALCRQCMSAVWVMMLTSRRKACVSRDVGMCESWCWHQLAVSQGKWMTHDIGINDSYILIMYESWGRQYVVASQMAGTIDDAHNNHWTTHSRVVCFCEWVVTLAGSNETSHYVVNGAYTNDNDACMHESSNDAWLVCASQIV